MKSCPLDTWSLGFPELAVLHVSGAHIQGVQHITVAEICLQS